MGYPANAQGVVQPGQASPIQLPTAGINPNATSRIDVEMNLDARAAVTLPPSGPQIDFGDATTYNNATSMTIYDAKGQDVALTYYFQKAGTDSWNVYVAANGTSILDNGGTPPVPQPVTTIQFPVDGGTPISPVGAVSIDIPVTTNSVGAETVPISGIGLHLGGASQYGSQFGVTSLSQDGFAAGTLTGVNVEDDGVLLARYSNGQSRPAGQLELANFRNPQGLQPLGGNAWARSYSSGTPVLGVPADGNLGVLQSGALEESNVDLTGELVNMITAQRLYQANAQTIKTQDQVLQTLVNLR
jgi:flagellar hook protein FlgE